MTANFSQSKTDRRVRRTRTLLTDALFSLLKEKSYKDITVKELCDAADINRGTFYLHYKDIYDMVEQIEQSVLFELTELVTMHTADNLHTNPAPIIHDIFELIGSQQDLCRALLGPNGDISFLTQVKQLFRGWLLEMYKPLLSEKDLVRFEYFYSYVAAGCVGLMESWLMSKNPEPVHEIADLASNIISTGVQIRPWQYTMEV